MLKMGNDRSVTAQILIDAPPAKVWEGLINPQLIKKYMGGADVVSDWRPGGPIIWQGLWQGNPYQDKGQILEFEPNRRLKYTHYSPASGMPNRPENYHVLTYSLIGRGGSTELVLLNENITTEAEQKYLERSWKIMLEDLKSVIERAGPL